MAEYMTQSVSWYESGHISIPGTISATRVSETRIACTTENKINEFLKAVLWNGYNKYYEKINIDSNKLFKLTSSERFRTNQNHTIKNMVSITPTHIPTILQVISLSTHWSPCFVGMSRRSFAATSKLLHDAINRTFVSFKRGKWLLKDLLLF